MMMADETEEASEEVKDEAELDAEAEELEEGGGKGGIKKLLIIIVPLLLIGIGAGLFFSGALGGKDKEAAAEHSEEYSEGDDTHGEEGYDNKSDDKKGDKYAEEGKSKGDAFVEVPDLIVNLASSTGQPHFLRLRVKLELRSPDDQAAIELILPRVIDRFQTFLREMRVEDLRGSAGIYRLRQELLFRVNKAAAPVEVKDVLFQEILIQ